MGLLLHIDEATFDLRRLSEARVWVEVNLDYDLPERIWIKKEKLSGYWQAILYEKLKFCYRCRYFGHTDDHCLLGTRLVPSSHTLVVLDVDLTPWPAISAKDKAKRNVVKAEPC